VSVKQQGSHLEAEELMDLPEHSNLSRTPEANQEKGSREDSRPPFEPRKRTSSASYSSVGFEHVDSLHLRRAYKKGGRSEEYPGLELLEMKTGTLSSNLPGQDKCSPTLNEGGKGRGGLYASPTDLFPIMGVFASTFPEESETLTGAQSQKMWEGVAA
jgi:hypothetical protein